MSTNLCSKVDGALVAYIISAGAGTSADVWPARRSLDKSLPCTVCWSHSATPPQEDPFSGNRMVEAFIEVRTSGVIEDTQTEDGPKEAAADRVGATWEAFGATGDPLDSSGLAAAITEAYMTFSRALGDLTIQSCKVVAENQGFNPRNPRTEGQAWVDTLHLEMLVSPGNVS